MVDPVLNDPGRVWRLLRRLSGHVFTFAVTVLGAALFVLVLLYSAPGDPIDLLPNADEVRPVLEAEWGLDKPLPVRFARWTAHALVGDFGTSVTYRPGAPVIEVIAGPALRSLAWAFCALGSALGIGTALAWFTAGRPALARRAVQAISLIPLFLLAHVLVAGLNDVTWRLMARGTIDRPSWFAIPDQPSTLRVVLAVGLLAVGSGALTGVHAAVEDALVRVRSSGYVDAARALGTPTAPHVWRNLLPEVAAIAAARTATFVGGLVVLEKVLLLNGVGAILWEAALLRDYNLAMGIAVVLALVVATTRLVSDVVRTWMDPRETAAEAP